jgi:1-acyl-sn-glycerol-3-phosphate acyltransferase
MNIQSIKLSKAGSYPSLFVHWCLICTHIFYGVFILVFVFPSSSIKNKHVHIQKWSLRLLTILGVQLRVINPSTLAISSYLLVSNHISWLDIHAINAFKPIRFVAKSEVESWPIFGWMAKQLGTVFIKRGNSRNAAEVVNNMAHILRSESICIFPEGTSTEGRSIRPFKTNLFESAVISKVPVYTVAIQYFDQITGTRSEAAAFVGEMGLLESISKILRHHHLRVDLTFFGPSEADPAFLSDRKWLALHSQEQISATLGPK